MRIMYDSDTASDIPTTATMVAGYVDLWSANDWLRFPNATKVRIARFEDQNGDVLDVESGLAAPAEAPNWCIRQRARGAIPTVYVSTSQWQTVRDAFTAAGVIEPLWWIAAYQWPNDPSIPTGAIAHQYASPSYGSGGHYDLSSVADFWPGVDIVSGSFKPGTHEYHWISRQHDGSVLHSAFDITLGKPTASENIGGASIGDTSGEWSSDAQLYTVSVTNPDNTVYLNTFDVLKNVWSGWYPTNVPSFPVLGNNPSHTHSVYATTGIPSS